MTFLSASIVFWRVWSAKRKEPDELTKMAFSAIFCALAPLMLVAAALSITPGHKASLWWGVGFELLNSIGFANLLPVGLALYARAAPQQANGTMVGVFMGSLFLADLVAGNVIGPFFQTLGATNFWALHAVIVAVAAVLLFVFRAAFGKLLGPAKR